jgi:hypothetical protein
MRVCKHAPIAAPCPRVCPHVAGLEAQKGFSCNIVLGTSVKTVLVKMGGQKRALYIKTPVSAHMFNVTHYILY